MKPSVNTYDPEYLQSLRELVVILLLFGVCFVWTIGVSALAGYNVAQHGVSEASGESSQTGSTGKHEVEGQADDSTLFGEKVGPDVGNMSNGQMAASIVLGMPSWVFWGIVLPWIIIDIAVIWFCFRFMQSNSLPQDEGHSHLVSEESTVSPGGRHGQ